MTDGPLDGLTIVELASDLAGAAAGQIMTDEGATVIKIEPPGGDPLRRADGSRLFQTLNRGKHSVVLDFYGATSVASREELGRLLARADAVIASWPRAQRDAAGADYPAVRARNPAIVYVSLCPFGERGEWAERPSNALVMQAISGLMGAEGKTADGVPTPLVATDMTGRSAGILAALGVSAGLFFRERTGIGQKIDISELAVAAFLQTGRTAEIPAADSRLRNPARDNVRALRAAGASYAAQHAARQAGLPIAFGPFYRGFVTADGAVFVGALSRGLRDRARRAFGTTLLHRDDPRWDPNDAAFVAECRAEEARIEQRFRAAPSAHWVQRCEAENVPVGAVAFPEDLASSPQAIANDYFVPVPDDTARPQQQAAPFIRFGRFPAPSPAGAPTLGEN